MRNRRLAISAAVVGSLGIALAPALAEAAQTSAYTSHFTSSVKGASTFVKNAGLKHYKGSSSRTMVKAKTSAATPNPNLDIDYDGYDTAAYSVEFDVAPSGLLSGSATVTVDWGDGTSDNMQVTPQTTDENPAPFTHQYSQLGTYNVTLTIDDGAGDTATATVNGVETAGSLYTAYGPTRILDTRKGLGESKAAPVGAKGTLKLQVTGAGTSGNTIPSGITAVVMNVTATGGTANGALTVFGNEDAQGDPITSADVTTSNLNYRTGQNIPNLVVVPIGADGIADFYNNSSGTVGVIADVAGYFTDDNSGDKYVSISPARILDTRKGLGASKAQIPANGSITLTVDGADGGTIPGSDVSAVALNLTAVDSTANGVITAYPSDQSLPTVSNINYSTGITVANMATVPVSSTGQITLHNSGNKPVDLLADAAGYYTSDSSAGNASAYVPFAVPDRFFDTRSPQFGDTPFPSQFPFGIPIASAGETAFVINATAVAPTANGFLSLYSFDPNNPDAVPTTSNLNYRTGQTVPNLAIVAPGTTADSNYDGAYDIGLYLGGSGESHVILDVFGMYTSN